jgi:hypothetical protein
MNTRDQGNLKFLLSIDRQGFIEWVNQASDDDIRYAVELIDEYTKGLASYCEEFRDTALVNSKPRLGSSSYPEANTVLSRFRLKN